MTEKIYSAVDVAIVYSAEGRALIVDADDGSRLSISLSGAMILALAREIESALPAPMSDPGVKAPAGPMRSSASKPRSPDDRSIRLCLVQALAPIIARGLGERPVDSAFVEKYFSAYGAIVDRLQAIVERAPAKDAAP